MNATYRIRNVANGKFYIGSSVNTRVRFQTHRRQLRTGKHHCQPLQRAWDKYGEDCFKFEVLQELPTPYDLFAAENLLLMDHHGKVHCYNVGTRAGASMLGRKHSDKSKARAALAQIGNHNRLGHTNSPEHRARQSASMRGIKKSPDHVEKIRSRMIGTAYAKGRVVTDEMRDKVSKPVLEVVSGVVFRSVIDAANHYGLQRCNVTRALRGNAPLKRGPCKGTHFQYDEGPMAQQG